MSNYAEGGENKIGLTPAQVGLFAAKLAVTCLCFWYLARNIDLSELLRAGRTLDLLWTSLAVLAFIIEILLVGLRWCKIVDALERGRERIRRGPMIAITMISNFFAQVVPNIAADTLRVWMLTQLGRGWRQSIASVMIDRAVGVAALIAIGFVVLQFPSALAALGGHRVTVMASFGAMLAAGGAGLILAPRLSVIMERWPYTASLGRLAKAAHSVLLDRAAGVSIAALAFGVHFLTILAVWLLARAAGLSLPIVDAAVLFVVMVAVALIPVSIGGWGVRELAVTSLLGSHGVPLERGAILLGMFRPHASDRRVAWSDRLGRLFAKPSASIRGRIRPMNAPPTIAMSPRKQAIRRLQDEVAPERQRWLKRGAFFHQEDLRYLKFLIPEGARFLSLAVGTGTCWRP